MTFLILMIRVPLQLWKASYYYCSRAKARTSPTKGASSSSSSAAAAAAAAVAAAAPLSLLSNNNYESEDGALKIDEDADIGKENSRPRLSPSRNKVRMTLLCRPNKRGQRFREPKTRPHATFDRVYLYS